MYKLEIVKIYAKILLGIKIQTLIKFDLLLCLFILFMVDFIIVRFSFITYCVFIQYTSFRKLQRKDCDK